MTNSRPASGRFEKSQRTTATLSTFWLLLAALAAALVLGACGDAEAFERFRKGDEEEEVRDPEKDKVPVEVATLELGPIEEILRFSTNLEAESSVQVFSQASRLVTELLVEEGMKVSKDQVLVRLQDDEQLSALARTKSQLAKAEREYERQKSLFNRALISEQTFNEATYEVEQLQLAYEDAERELSYTEVRAPISGTITQRLVNLGDNIQVGAHLFDIVDFDTIVARVFVPEKDLSRLALGQTARLRSESLEGAREGEVIRIAPVVDPRSGTVKITIGIDANQGLLPGQYVETELVVDTEEQALLVPKRALIFDDTQVFAYRLTEEMKVERLLVVPRIQDRLFISPGPSPSGEQLAMGDRIVIAGQAGLKDGADVRLADTERGLPEEERSEL